VQDYRSVNLHAMSVSPYGLQAEIERGLAQAKALRRSILAAAFRGQLVPQGPWDEPASVLLERIRAEREAAGPLRRSRS